jgi:hypothetical protein
VTFLLSLLGTTSMAIFYCCGAIASEHFEVVSVGRDAIVKAGLGWLVQRSCAADAFGGLGSNTVILT